MQRGHVVIGATVIGLAGLLAFDQVQFGNPFALRNDNAPRVLAAGTSAATKVAGARSATGVAVPNQYGSVQVRVSVKDGRIVSVNAVELPYGDPESAGISDRSAPILAQQAIDVQSADIAGLSGATYTSDGYRQSLQSALDQLGFASTAGAASVAPTTEQTLPDAAPETVPTAPTEPEVTPGTGDGSATGDPVPNRWGTVQVEATVEDGRLTRITFLDLPYADGTSQAISDNAAAILTQQAIDAQSAQVDGVSGATYTSDGYRRSLQSALDQLGFPQQ
jgi:uncharacterized protein with FMN-binding domain